MSVFLSFDAELFAVSIGVVVYRGRENARKEQGNEKDWEMNKEGEKATQKKRKMGVKKTKKWVPFARQRITHTKQRFLDFSRKQKLNLVHLGACWWFGSMLGTFYCSYHCTSSLLCSSINSLCAKVNVSMYFPDYFFHLFH